MSPGLKLNIVKAIHTAIWIFFSGVMIFLYFSVISGSIDKWVWIVIGIIILEVLYCSDSKDPARLP